MIANRRYSVTLCIMCRSQLIVPQNTEFQVLMLRKGFWSDLSKKVWDS